MLVKLVEGHVSRTSRSTCK